MEIIGLSIEKIGSPRKLCGRSSSFNLRNCPKMDNFAAKTWFSRDTNKVDVMWEIVSKKNNEKFKNKEVPRSEIEF